MSCGRIKRLRHNPALSDEDFLKWLKIRRSGLEQRVHFWKLAAEYTDIHYVRRQAEYLVDLLKEVEEAIERLSKALAARSQ